MTDQNITLAFPRELLQRAKLIAVKRNTSVSALVREYLEKIVSEEEGYLQAQEFCLREMKQGYDIGARPGSYAREELHERK